MSEISPIAYTILEAARVSGLGRTTIYELLGAGKLHAKKAGNRTLIPAESLLRYLENLPAAAIRTGKRAA